MANPPYMIRLTVEQREKADRIACDLGYPSMAAMIRGWIEDYELPEDHVALLEELDEMTKTTRRLVNQIQRLPTYGMYGGPGLEDLGG